MSSGVFLIQDGGGLIEMRSAPYDSEALLQNLLAEYPNLLAGDQMNSEAPRKWLLVSREMAIPDEKDGAGRWSLDHLFLDQEGIPTLVEVKRSTDTRIRREVVGQMLDYAANAVVYWPVEKIRAQFEANCENQGVDPQERIADIRDGDEDIDAFWMAVKTNLSAGRIRMVFVADTIPPELQRIIEFLNAQMSNSEVLGIAISQFQGEGRRLLVPRVVGLTATAQRNKNVGGSEALWDETSFFDALGKTLSAEEVEVARQILDWAVKSADRLYWGRGKKVGSFVPVWVRGDTKYVPFAIYTYGKVMLQVDSFRKRPKFADEEVRRDFLQRIGAVIGTAFPDSAIDSRPTIPFSSLCGKERLAQFLAILDSIVEMM